MNKLLSSFSAVAIFAIASTCFGQEAKMDMEIVGFSADASQMLVKTDDDNIGLALRVYDVESGQPAKKSAWIPYTRAESAKVIKETRKKNKITDPGVEDTLYPMDPKDETKSLSFFGLMANKERFVIAVTDRQKMGKVMDVKIKVDEETKKQAKASLKAIFWTTDRKTMVCVVKQKLAVEGFAREVDEFYAKKFKMDEVQWIEQEPPPEEKKKDGEKPPEEKKKGWWPFG